MTRCSRRFAVNLREHWNVVSLINYIFYQFDLTYIFKADAFVELSEESKL